MATVVEQDFKNTLAAHPGAEKLLGCFLCGTCTAGCPISEIDKDYDPRKMMRKILLGKKDEVLKSSELWKCYQCHTCVAHCPQDVRFADVVRAAREFAAQEGACDSKLASKIAELDLKARKQRLADVSKLLS
jgi:heterodisulfide reductase subunit C